DGVGSPSSKSRPEAMTIAGRESAAQDMKHVYPCRWQRYHQSGERGGLMPVMSVTVADELSKRTDARLLLLTPRDNVLGAKARIRAGERVDIGGPVTVMPTDVPIGYKLAREAIAAGAKIVKYGAPIGSATASIAVGELVHVHNVKSDYTPTYHLED